MDNKIRLQYLEAMGIDVWILKAPVQNEQELLSDHGVDNAEPDTEAVTRWIALQEEVSGCTRCALCATRTQTVFGAGNNQADWLLVGEGPGQHEDEQGKPFVGKAGQLLTEMLRAMDIEREDVFITNIVKCRPPHNREPETIEIESCKHYLQQQQAFIQPKIILAIGRVAAQTLLNTDEPLAKLRGKVHYLNNTPVIVVYHPAYLLRSLSEKRKAWLDLQLAMQTLKQREN